MLWLFRGGAVEVFAVGAVETGIVVKSALQAYMGGALPRFDQLAGFHQALNGQILPYGGAGCCPEYPAKLGFADVKPVADIFQRNGLLQMFVQIADDPVSRRVGIGAGILGRLGLDTQHLVQQSVPSRPPSGSPRRKCPLQTA